MRADLQSVKEALQQHADLVHHGIRPTLDQAERLLSDTLRELAGFEDSAAREARALAINALDLIRSVSYGWLNDYVREAEELSRRIDQ